MGSPLFIFVWDVLISDRHRVVIGQLIRLFAPFIFYYSGLSAITSRQEPPQNKFRENRAIAKNRPATNWTRNPNVWNGLEQTLYIWVEVSFYISTSWWSSRWWTIESLRAHVAKFYGRLRMIRSVLRASKFPVLKLIKIVILWVYYTIPFGFSLFWHVRTTICNFSTTLFGQGSLTRVHYSKCAYGPYCFKSE